MMPTNADVALGEAVVLSQHLSGGGWVVPNPMAPAEQAPQASFCSALITAWGLSTLGARIAQLDWNEPRATT